MERRWSARTPAMVDVDLDFDGHRLANCHTRDIAMGGTFVERRDQLPVEGAKVQLTFHLEVKEQPKHYILQAKVVRVEEAGIGLMFENHGISEFRSLQVLLHHAKNHTH